MPTEQKPSLNELVASTANIQRLDMHPDDQFAAFHALVTEKQMPIEDIAARLGVTPALVARRLKLANVSPLVRAFYRKGDLSLEQMMAFGALLICGVCNDALAAAEAEPGSPVDDPARAAP